LHVVPFFHEPLCAVVPEDHGLAGRLTVRAAALAQEAFVLFPRHRAPHFYDALTRLCAEAGFSPNVRYEAADWQVMVSIIAAGLGVTLAPDSVRWLGRPGVSYVRLTPARKVAQLCLVHDVENSSPLKSIFIKVARSAAVRSQ
jgi:DNA-binding transcriptional LysR family regulator